MQITVGIDKFRENMCRNSKDEEVLIAIMEKLNEKYHLNVTSGRWSNNHPHSLLWIESRGPARKADEEDIKLFCQLHSDKPKNRLKQSLVTWLHGKGGGYSVEESNEIASRYVPECTKTYKPRVVPKGIDYDERSREATRRGRELGIYW